MVLETAIVCLALNIYWEARNQSVLGKIAVAQTTMNRVYDARYPDDVCSVVYQGQKYSWKPYNMVRHKCQFSWYCDGKSDEPKNKDAWESSLRIADGVYNSKIYDIVDGATHYHAYYILPSWSASKTKITRIDDHIFYRWESRQ
tara:strand:+ start:529 stop:960 length:432 start_codon:yes stop_codon:yes gene_type:complete